MIYSFDKKYNFFEIFNDKTGAMLRSNVIISGKESVAPTMRSFPELIDVGIMGHCHAANCNLCKNFGVDCYQSAHSIWRNNLNLHAFRRILDQSQGRVFQIVLGGAGDPIKHEDFKEILYLTRKAGIVPNLTTTGFELTDNEAVCMGEHCGAVAVSFYSRLDKNLNETSNVPFDAVDSLLKAGCSVNIHFVLSKRTIRDAIFRLNNKRFPAGISSVIFLLYKAVGEGRECDVLDIQGNDYLAFLDLVQNNDFDFSIGFDTCQTPYIRKNCKKVWNGSIEACESGRFSMYIDCDFSAHPCSFSTSNKEFRVDLNSFSIEDAWNSYQFESFRHKQEQICNGCLQEDCRSCPLKIANDFCSIKN